MYNSVAVIVCTWPPFLNRSLGELYPLAQRLNLGGHFLYRRTSSGWEGVPGALEEEYERKEKEGQRHQDIDGILAGLGY